MNEFAAELKLLLKKAKISQGELSRRAHISATHVSNIMNGKRLPTRPTLSKIIAAIGSNEKDRTKLVAAIGRTKYD